MGELHLEIIVDRLMREFNVNANVGRPQAAYRETIEKLPEKVEGRFVRQTGGRGQYGHAVINPSPGRSRRRLRVRRQDRRRQDPASTSRPSTWASRRRWRSGLAGYPVVDVIVELVDGSYHDVDSSEMAFKVAGSMAFKNAMQRAKPKLLSR